MSNYDLSLMPSGGRSAGSLSLSRTTIKVLLICGAVLLALFAMRFYFNKQATTSTAQLTQAKASKAQLELRSQSIKKQLGALQGAGGASKIDLVRGLSNVPTDWKKILLVVAQESSPGISITTFTGSATSGSAAAESSDSQAGALNSVQLSGSAESQAQMQAFVKRLRSNSKTFTSVELKKASAADPGVENPDQPAAKKSSRWDWEMVLSLPPGAPMPPGGASEEGQ